MRYLVERSAEGKFRSSRVLNQDSQVQLRQLQALRGFSNRARNQLQTFFAAASTERSRMQHQKLGVQGQSALQFATKRDHRFAMELRRRAGQVHQVAAMD